MAGGTSTPQQGSSRAAPRVAYVSPQELEEVIKLSVEHDLPTLWSMACELQALRAEYHRVVQEHGRLLARMPYPYDAQPIVTDRT